MDTIGDMEEIAAPEPQLLAEEGSKGKKSKKNS
jgi:hypothetical protein